MKILLLEDDPRTAEQVRLGLERAGHWVDACETGREAFRLGTSRDYGAFILDRMTPELDGLSVLTALRSAGVQTPALLLTAMDGVNDRVEGLEAGADDYLVKPFAMSELLARVNAITRRVDTQVQTRLRVADLEMDLIQRTVTRAGRRLVLQPQEFKILEFLMRHAGQAITRAMLLQNVWSFHFDPQTNIVESHMSRLRSKVDRDFDRELIRTIRGVGYRIDEPG